MTNISDTAKSIQREYLRSWREQHPEKVREYNRRYWEKKAAQTAAKKEGKHGNGGETST